METNLDFGIHTPIELFRVGDQVFGLTTTHINTFIIMIGFLIFGLYVRHRVKSFEMVPTTKFQVIIETIVGMLSDFTASTMGEANRNFCYYYGPLFLYILTSNLVGLIGLRPPTADIATTLSLGVTTFVMIHAYGIKARGLSYFKGFLEPMPLLLPINIIGELATPVSLSFRLFGNILGGTIIMGLYYAMMPLILKLGLPAIFHMYFDIFSGVLQSFIFVMLSMTFVSNAMEG